MRAALRDIACVLALMLCACGVSGGMMISGEAGSFVFTADGYFSDKPITVYYYKPRTASPDAKVLFTIHGAERGGKLALENWVQFSEKNQLIVLAPEFDQQRFPEKAFQLGGMEERDGSKWTFSVIEQLFDKVRKEEQLNTPTYLLFGHSAGGQFVERFVIMMDKARYSRAVAANPGSHTMPVYPSSVFEFGFPWVLSEQRVDAIKLQTVMGRNLVLMLGEKDLDMEGPYVPNAKQAKAQGAHRFERGQRFYALAKEQAARMGVPLQWRLVTLPGVGHSERSTSRAAARIFFENESRLVDSKQ